MNSSEANHLLGALRVVDGTDFPRADSATVLATPPNALFKGIDLSNQ
jgi:hypothetical protein